MRLNWLVTKTKNKYDGKFGWKLRVTGIPLNCPELAFEQFAKGSYLLSFIDGSSIRGFAKEDLKKLNPNARVFGDWIEDLLPNMKTGPKLVSTYEHAQCRPGIVKKTTTPLQIIGPKVGGGTYYFADDPGPFSKFGEEVKHHKIARGSQKRFKGVSWYVSFNHKLWLRGQKLGEIIFDLRGEHSVRLASHDKTKVIITDTRQIIGIKKL